MFLLQPKQKSKSKRSNESKLHDELSKPSTFLHGGESEPKSENIEHQLADALKDCKISQEQEMSDPEDSPLLSGSQGKATDVDCSSSHSLDETVYAPANECFAVQESQPEIVTKNNVPEDILVQVDSPVCQPLTTHNSHAELRDDIGAQSQAEQPYHTVSEQLERIRTSEEVEEGVEALSSTHNDPKTVRKDSISHKKTKIQPKSSVDNCQSMLSRSSIENPATIIVKPFSEVELSALYCNRELDACVEFVSSFVESHLRPSCKQTHPLHDLLVIYLRSINRLVVNHMELDAMKKESKEKQCQLWILETTTITESGECQDGNPVSASHVYQMSRLNRPILSQLRRLLAGMRELVNITHSLDAYLCEAARLQIEGLIQSVAQSCPELAALSQNMEPCLSLGAHSPRYFTHSLLVLLLFCVSLIQMVFILLISV